MQQLSFFLEENVDSPNGKTPNGVKPLTRTKLAYLDYEASCPLSFIQAAGYCHQCVFFDGGEIDESTSPPTVLMRCSAHQYQGPEYGYKPGHIREGWRSIPAWVEEMYENETQNMP